MVTPSSPDFHVHDGDTKKFGQLHEDRIQSLLPLVHQLLQKVLAVGVPGRGGGNVTWW